MTLYVEGASTTMKLTSIEACCGCVPIKIGNSIILSNFMVDPLNTTNKVAVGLSLFLEIPSWSNPSEKNISDELLVSTNTLLTEIL